MPVIYQTVQTEADLLGILRLQKANLARSLESREIESQGFVTVDHSFDQLKKLNDIEPHVIARDGDQVIGYILAMTARSREDIPVLVPMFRLFDQIPFGGKTISGFRYMVIGQVCIARAYRGQGVFDQCYAKYREQYGQTYAFAITEIAASNLRSLKAHARVGFRDLLRYQGPDGTEWVVVLWDWTRS